MTRIPSVPPPQNTSDYISNMLAWTETQLATSTATYTVIGAHFPLFGGKARMAGPRESASHLPHPRFIWRSLRAKSECWADR